MAETKCRMKRDYGPEEDRNCKKTEVKNDTVKKRGEENSAGIQAAGQGGRVGLWVIENANLPFLKMLCKLSLHVSRNWLQVEQEEDKKNPHCP